MSEREYNEEQYNKQRIEGDDLHNAVVCDQIADESLGWYPNEAIYWRKLAIEHAEKYYGKNKIENTIYYEKLAEDYSQKSSHSQALKWHNKAKKIKVKQWGEYSIELLEVELRELELYYHMDKYDELPKVREHIKIILEKNPDCEGTLLYKAYLEMAMCRRWNEKSDEKLEFIDSAMQIAERVYGEISMEVADAYRLKAWTIWNTAENDEEKKEAIELNNKAYYIGTHAKDNGRGSWILSSIVQNMKEMTLPDENSVGKLPETEEKVLTKLSPELEEKIEELYEKGNRLEKEECYDEALQAWQEGYGLIPVDLRWDLDGTNQFLAAMGDVYFLRKGMYQEAYECFDTARGYGGYDNPFIMLRLGECCLELGDEKNAMEYLMRAWMMEGEEIFEPDENGEDDGSKYLEFLRTHVDLEKE